MFRTDIILNVYLTIVFILRFSIYQIRYNIISVENNCAIGFNVQKSG